MAAEKKQECRKDRERRYQLKLLPLMILRVLEKESSSDNLMSISRIRKRIEESFGVDVERRTISSNLSMLKAFDMRVCCDIRERSDGKGGSQTVSVGWHCEPCLESEELRYLADAIFSSNGMPQKQKRDLWEKLRLLGDARKLGGFSDIYSADPRVVENKQLFYTISILDEALAGGYQVRFQTGSYRCGRAAGDLASGIEIEAAEGEEYRIVEPRFMAISRGRYYLVANYPNQSKRYHFRVDLIVNPSLCEGPDGFPIEATVKPDKRQDIQAYLDRHLYMYSDPIVSVRFRIADNPDARHQVFDHFGKSAKLCQEDEGKHLVVTVEANERAMLHWAMQFSGIVEVIEPQSLRERLRSEAQRVAELYAKKPTG